MKKRYFAYGAACLCLAGLVSLMDDPEPKATASASSPKPAESKPSKATTVAAKPDVKNMTDHETCLHYKAMFNEIEPGLGDKSYDCERVRTWVNPLQMVKNAGGATSLIWKCHDEIRPTLKDPRSFEEVRSKALADPDKKTVGAWVEYRAKNSFGGYVIEEKTCTWQA